MIKSTDNPLHPAAALLFLVPGGDNIASFFLAATFSARRRWIILLTNTASYRFLAAPGTGVGRDSLLVFWVLAWVLTLVREVVVAVLIIEERSDARSEAVVDVKEFLDERGV